MEEIQEIVKFLQLGARLDLKAVSLQHVLSLTGTDEGLAVITEKPELLTCLISLMSDKMPTITKDASLALVNISANENGATKLINLNLNENTSLLQSPPKNIVATCLNVIIDEDSTIADPACMILSNVTRPSALIDKVIDFIEESDVKLDKLVHVFTKKSYNKKGATLHYLGPMFSNLTQSSRVRQYILDKKKCVIQRFLPFTEYQDSTVRRGGIVGTLKNCCFEENDHDWLLSPDVDILPRLLFPLAGPEEFDEEDNDKLPLELQFLPEDKTREEDPDIRSMLLEAITQLCAKKKNREYIRNKNTYVILRELHKWEKDRGALLSCENLVDILIRSEDEIGEDNLKLVEVPEDLQEKFKRMDEEFLRDTNL